MIMSLISGILKLGRARHVINLSKLGICLSSRGIESSEVQLPLKEQTLPSQENCQMTAKETEKVEEEVAFSVSHEDFKWVERLLPPSLIPQPPQHEVYPTPSGWVAQSETTPDEAYFVRRTKYHELPILEQEKPAKTGRWLTKIRYIEGNIWALERELVEVVRPNCKFDPATRVHELSQTIWIKGLHKNLVEDFLYSKGF